MRVYAEVKWFFPDAQNRAKVHGVEVDVWIPSRMIAIEVDGHHWHKDSLDKDKAKDALLVKKGITIIRLREKPLCSIGTNSISYEHGENHFSICGKLMRMLFSIIGVNPGYDRLMNNLLFSEILSGSSPENDRNKLFLVRPELRDEWHQEKNLALKFTDVTRGSGRQVWWKCRKGHEWMATPNARGDGRNCPYCSGRRPSPERNLAVLFPRIASQLSARNEIGPDKVSIGSTRKMWWICDEGHEWMASVNARTNVGTGCPCCYRMRKASSGKAHIAEALDGSKTDYPKYQLEVLEKIRSERPRYNVKQSP